MQRDRRVQVVCADGVRLEADFFPVDPDARPGPCVILSSAILVRRGFYAPFARWLAARGCPVLCCDNRGVGGSLDAAGPRPRLEDWGLQDLPALIAWLQAEQPGRPVFVVGHSMGGQLATLSPASAALAGVVTVAATAAWWGHWRAPASLGILGAYLLIPSLGRAMGRFPARRLRVGPDTRFSVLRTWARWGRHPDYLFGPFGLRPFHGDFTGPVLAWGFDDDRFATRQAVDALHARLRKARVERRQVPRRSPALGHFGFFRESQAMDLWEQTLAWMRAQAS